jgi:predicted small integral membrane protein
MPIVRLAKIIMCFTLGLFCLLVAFDNVVDPRTNYAFVQHVLSMDSTFAESGLKYRAMTSPVAWQIAFVAIVAAEALTGLLFAVATVALWRARLSPADAFNNAKGYAIAAATLAFIVWFFGFMVIGGEWFEMWQSKIWNGQEAAFRFYISVLAALVFINQPDAEIV